MKNSRNLFSGVMILFWLSLYAYVPQMANYAKELGASYKLIGLIAGAYGFSQTILRIPLGILSDKLGNRKVFILLGIFSAILSAVIVIISPNPYTLLIARLLAGVASATWVNFTVLFLSYYQADESSKSLAIATSNSKIGQLIAMLIGGFVAINYGVINIFIISIITAVLSLIFGFFIKEIKIEPNNKEANKNELKAVIENKRILKISFLGIIVQFISYATAFGFTPLVAADLGANDLQLSYLSVAYTLPQIVFTVIAGTVMVKKFGEKNSLILGFLVSSILCFITPFAPTLAVLYIIQFLSGIGNAITFPILMSMVMEGVEYHLMTTTMGFYQAAYGVGMIAGPIILGSIGDYLGLGYGFFAVGFLSLFSIYTLIKIK